MNKGILEVEFILHTFEQYCMNPSF